MTAKVSSGLSFGLQKGQILPAAMLLLSLMVVVLAIFGDQGFFQAHQLERDLSQSRARISSLTRENLKLRFQAFQLQNDSFWVEKMAREDLDLARPGEKVYRLSRGH